MKNIKIKPLFYGAVLILMIVVGWWNLSPMFMESRKIVTVENAPFRSPMADLRGTGSDERFFVCQITINGVMQWIRVPLSNVKIVAREDGQAVTTISGTYQGFSGHLNWLEATIAVSPEDREAWERQMQYYNPELPVRVDPDLGLR